MNMEEILRRTMTPGVAGRSNGTEAAAAAAAAAVAASGLAAAGPGPGAGSLGAGDEESQRNLYLMMSAGRRGARGKGPVKTLEQLQCPVLMCRQVFNKEQHDEYDAHVHHHVSEELRKHRESVEKVRGNKPEQNIGAESLQDRFHAILEATKSGTQQKISVRVGETKPEPGAPVRDPVIGEFETVLTIGPMTQKEAKEFAKRWKQLTMHNPKIREEVGRQLMEEREERLMSATETEDDDRAEQWETVTFDDLKEQGLAGNREAQGFGLS